MKLYDIKTEEASGRGLYAAKEISPGEVISVCELLVLNPIDTIAVNQTDLRYYVFKYSENQDCLVLGDGELFNHSDAPNVSFSLEKVDNRLKMIFKCVKTIVTGEQLLIDYASDEKVEILNYINTKSLVS